jgi:uroporphyrinogen decarboxylase
MSYGQPDRAPLFEEGIREEVLQVWRAQGLTPDVSPEELFPTDRREELAPDLEPRPFPRGWTAKGGLPAKRADLDALRQSLNPQDPDRFPADWSQRVSAWPGREYPLLLRVSRGFFQTMDVGDWRTIKGLMHLLKNDPALVGEIMMVHGEFTAALIERVLGEVEIDAAIFSEPIAGNHGPLISPQMIEELVLPSYTPILEALRRHRVETLIVRTYANARALIPSFIKWGFNCLWACEVGVETMDYRDIRREFGPDLRLIAGIDVDALLGDKETIRREVEGKVPPLLKSGGYAPLADGRVRGYVPLENYIYYRELLTEVVGGF